MRYMEPEDSQGVDPIAWSNEETPEKFLDRIADELEIEAEWSMKSDGKLVWWGSNLKQTMWVEEVDPVKPLFALQIRTDCLRNYTNDPLGLHILSFNGEHLTCSSYAKSHEDPTRIQLAAKIYFNQATVDEIAAFCVWTAALQLNEASLMGRAICKSLSEASPEASPEVDASAHPAMGSREETAATLSKMISLTKNFGQVSGLCDEVLDMVEDFAERANVVHAIRAGGEVTVHFPFPHLTTCMMQIEADRAHLFYGNCLNVRLSLHDFPDASSALDAAALELETTHKSSVIGSWMLTKEGHWVHQTRMPVASQAWVGPTRGELDDFSSQLDCRRPP